MGYVADGHRASPFGAMPMRFAEGIAIDRRRDADAEAAMARSGLPMIDTGGAGRLSDGHHARVPLGRSGRRRLLPRLSLFWRRLRRCERLVSRWQSGRYSADERLFAMSISRGRICRAKRFRATPIDYDSFSLLAARLVGRVGRSRARP